jgi:uncharacterized protein YegL
MSSQQPPATAPKDSYVVVGCFLGSLRVITVVCIIMTDGQENASSRFTKADIQGKIVRREQAGNWTFVYLGANQDAWAVARDLGIPQVNAVNYQTNDSVKTFRIISSSVAAYTSSGLASTDRFFDNHTRSYPV